MSRPRGWSVRRDTQVQDRPRRARPTAVFSSAPPTWTSRLRACSRRRKFGGLSRIIASPKVITSTIGIYSLSFLLGVPHLLDDRHVLPGEFADAVKVALDDRL